MTSSIYMATFMLDIMVHELSHRNMDRLNRTSPYIWVVQLTTNTNTNNDTITIARSTLENTWSSFLEGSHNVGPMPLLPTRTHAQLRYMMHWHFFGLKGSLNLESQNELTLGYLHEHHDNRKPLYTKYWTNDNNNQSATMTEDSWLTISNSNSSPNIPQDHPPARTHIVDAPWRSLRETHPRRSALPTEKFVIKSCKIIRSLIISNSKLPFQ